MERLPRSALTPGAGRAWGTEPTARLLEEGATGLPGAAACLGVFLQEMRLTGAWRVQADSGEAGGF